MGKSYRLLVPALLALSALTPAWGQSAKVWEEHSQLIESRRTITALDMDLFGDRISYYTGGLSFSVTDVDLPGNDALPVSVTRVFHGIHNEYYDGNGAFGDWSIDLPNVNGVYLEQTGWVASVPGAPQQRCSISSVAHGRPPNAAPGGATFVSSHEIWHGNELNIPGRGTADLLLTAGISASKPSAGTWYWVTNDWTYLSCLPTIKNGGGEGFMALTQDGTRYWFDWMAATPAPSLDKDDFLLHRARYALYATKVEDRFGNWVTYTYTNGAGERVRPTRIESSDGRVITFAYSGGRISSVSAHGRTWAYQYSGPVSRLTSVVLPDASQWAIDFSGFVGTILELHYDPPSPRPGEPWRGCSWLPQIKDVEWVGRITHPSGAVGEFTFAPRQFGRSQVPRQCSKVITDPTHPSYHDPYRNYEYSDHPVVWYSHALVKKRVSGPGVPLAEWHYDYSHARGFAPISGSSIAEVTGPGGEFTRYTFGNQYRDDEGLLLKVERGTGPTNIQQVEETGYQISADGHPFPARVGTHPRGDKFGAEALRPRRTSTISQQGVDFRRQVNTFDAFARPLQVTKSSNLPGNPSRVEITAYHDNLSKWVLGQTSRLTVNGIVASETSYNANAQPTVFKEFGRVDQTLGYASDGTVASVADGNNNVTTLSSWKRGIPRAIAYPATPESPSGASQSAVVNDAGWVTRITDPNGFQSNYQYDPMGRLSRVIYPAGDSMAWNDTILTFAKAGSSAYGIPAGHWQHTVATGNGRKVTYLDALWRPLLVREYDTGNAAGTQRFTKQAFDHEGRVTFSSYPSASGTPSTGTWSEYDALGRPTSVSQDSELGLLVTSSAYLSGFQTRVTSPKGHQTTTRYLAWDQPSTEFPLAITHPGGVFTDIARDTFGKPTSITRRNGTGSISLSRSYVYDAQQRLCKSIEPETGATIMAYDGAGNLTWSRAGATQTSTSSCNTGDIPIAQRTVRSYDARNRIRSLVFPDNLGNTTYEYTPDGLLSQIAVDNGGADVVSTAYTYNRRRLPTGEGVSVGVHQWGIGYGYNANGHLQANTLPDGTAVDYSPNALGQPTRAGAYATNVTWFPNGGLKQFTYGNGIVRTLTQNARGFLDRSRDTYSSAVFHDDGFDYDTHGNVAAISDGLPGNRGDRTMTYDALDRLTGTVSPMFGTATYTYDALDNLNRVRLTAGPKMRDHTYIYDSHNRLNLVTNTSGGATVAALAYDAQGNLANRSGQAYQFDYGNRLRSVPGVESYLYDGHGRRVRATRNGASIYSVYGQDGVLRYQRDERIGKTSAYVHLGGSLLASLESAISLAVPTLTVPGYSATGSYTASWTPSAHATKYQLQERLGSGSWSTIHDAAGTSKAVSGKAAGSWGYRVRACHASACGTWSTVSSVTVQLPPSAAPDLQVPSQGLNGSYTVNWTSIPAADRYQLQERQGSGSWSTIHDASGTSKAVSGRAAGSWGYRVQACNDAGCSGWSSTATVQVIHPPASAPPLTAPASNLTGGYTVSWDSVSTATRYQLQERLGSGGWTTIFDAGGTSHAVSGKTTGNWGYRVRACNAAGCSAYSATATVAVTRPPTSAPALTVPSSNTSGAYTASWGSVAAASRYELQERLGSGGWTKIHDAATTSKAVSGKTTGSWSYRVRACNAAGCGGYSSTGIVSVLRPPTPAPTVTAPSSSNNGNFTVSWTSPAHSVSFQLQERLGSGSWSTIQDATATSRLIKSKPNGSWQYRARACNSSGCGSWSATRTVQVTLAIPTTAPTLSVPSPVNAWANVYIDWTAVTHASEYRLERSLGGVNWSQIAVVSSAGTSIQAPGYVSGDHYWYRVRGCSSLGCGPYSGPEMMIVRDCSTGCIEP